MRDNFRMFESDDPHRPDEGGTRDDELEPAPPPEESRTPPHGDPLADDADEDDASNPGGVRD